jgi:sarcosine oxidase subunit gamma
MMLRPNVALAAIMARRNEIDALRAQLRAAFALDLPLTPRRVAAGAIGIAWSGPAQWLATAEALSGPQLEAALRREFAGLAAVADQSDARIVIRIAGPRAREALAKGVPIDLHPRAFAPGDTACTVAGLIAVQLWQLDEAPGYDLLVARSFAADLWEWLVAASAEFGVAVTDIC